MPIRFARIMVYSGPPLIYWMFINFHEEAYKFICSFWLGDYLYLDNSQEDMILWEPGTVELMAFYMIVIHFGKLFLETFFLQRYTGRMISRFTVFWEMVLYWGILGVLVGFSLFHTQYMPSIFFIDLDNFNIFSVMAFGMFLFAEFMNLLCKLHFYL